MVGLLVAVLVLVLILVLLHFVFQYVPLPTNIKNLILVVVAIIGLIYLLTGAVGVLPGLE